MIPELPSAWFSELKLIVSDNRYQQLMTAVEQAYSATTCYPPARLIFEAFNLLPPDAVSVVILGQDPYHKAGQAHGLSFSVPAGQALPPSLRNIYKELKTDIPGFEVPFDGDLHGWAHQGVLLLNAVLSVEAGKPGSHKHLGWEWFTDAVIQHLNDSRQHLVFMLWGAFAQTKVPLIDPAKHLVLTAAHPSPLARGAFFGCRHFSQCNAYLAQQHKQIVTW